MRFEVDKNAVAWLVLILLAFGALVQDTVPYLSLSPDFQWWIAIIRRLANSDAAQVAMLVSLNMFLLYWIIDVCKPWLMHKSRSTGGYAAFATLLLQIIFTANFLLRKTDTSSRANLLLLLSGQAIVVFVKMYIVRPPPVFQKVLLYCLTAALVMVSTLDVPHSERIKYRGVVREQGLWDNPNTYGLLSACFCVVLLGTIVSRLQRQFVHESSHCEGELLCNSEVKTSQRPVYVVSNGNLYRASLQLPLHILQTAGYVTFGFVGVDGLIKSLSRGAWLACFCGTAFICLKAVGVSRSRADKVTLRPILSLARSYTVVSVFGVVVWCILVCSSIQNGAFDSAALNRIKSVVNVEDMSWRNRVYAWVAAWKLSFIQPLNGLGIGNVENMYRLHYLSPNVKQTAAINTNDLLRISAALGLVPFCLMMWQLVSGIRIGFNRGDFSLPPVITLLVGSWFNEVLFSSTLGILFWILFGLMISTAFCTEDRPSTDSDGTNDVGRDKANALLKTEMS